MLISFLCRLARPSLAQQHPIAHDYLANIQNSAPDQEFLLSSSLSLPPAFGSAYVGETFSCSLCANNELVEGGANKSITSVHLTAEMQTPSQQQIALPTSENENEDDANATFPSGASIQRIVRFDLKEEGTHVLVVNLTYTESTTSQDVASGGRVRSFRKLYQFQAQPCLSVRTKATELASREVSNKSLGPYGRSTLVRYVLEAQLENVSEGGIVLEQARLLAYPPLIATSLNLDMIATGDQRGGNPLLNPRDVLQLAFLVEQDAENTEGVDELKINIKRDGRTPLGQIALDWRSGMGEKGQLTTGTLFSRKRA